MAGNIKGITIEFRGETTSLDKALRKIGSEANSTQRELTSINKALKFNPTSVELWRQKQQVLNDKIKQTEERQAALKQAMKNMDESRVSRETEEYRRLQRELIETESKLKTFKAQLREIGNVNLRAASEQIKEMGNKLTGAGQAIMGVSTAAAAATAAIGAAAVKSGAWADDLNTMSKIYGISTTELQKYSAAADLVDVSVEDIAKSHIKLEKSMYAAQTGSASAMTAFDRLGISITNSDGSLRDADAVWQEAITALGSMTNETERDAIAMQLMGKSAANLNPLIEDNGETYKMVSDTMAKYGLDYVDQETLNKANQFNDSLDKTKLLGETAFNQMATELSAYLAPAMEKVVEIVGKLAEWLSNLSPETLTVIASIAAVVAILAPLLIGLGKVSFAISSIMSLASTLGPVFGALAGPVGIIIAVFAALVAAGVLIYKNWDTIKAKAIAFKTAVVATFEAFKSSVTTTFNNIKNAIVTPIQTAIDKIKGIIEKVKNFFPIKVGNLLSGLKLPHFKLTGEFSLKNKTVPHLSVDWYKTGGIFDGPSVIGVGEAGPEAVVPLDKLWTKLDEIASASGGGPTIIINGYDKDKRELAEEIKRILIKETNQRRLAWQ